MTREGSFFYTFSRFQLDSPFPSSLSFYCRLWMEKMKRRRRRESEQHCDCIKYHLIQSRDCLVFMKPLNSIRKRYMSTETMMMIKSYESRKEFELFVWHTRERFCVWDFCAIWKRWKPKKAIRELSQQWLVMWDVSEWGEEWNYVTT